MLRRYLVESMAVALERIRAELGPDAVVVESRKVRRRFWQKPLVEVLASNGKANAHPAPSTNPLPLVAEGPLNALEAAALSSPLRPLWNVLRDQDVDDQLALELVVATATSSDPATWTSVALARDALTSQLEQRVRTTGPLPLQCDRPTLMAIVGPTGVGKTTTIAKLATCAQAEGFSVALVTIDTYRAGAIAQIQSYAEILNVPFHVAYSPTELRDTIRNLRETDLVLIDTPGCGSNNQNLLGELDQYLAVVTECEVHLALACGAQLTEMLETTRAFGSLPLAGVILTKVDEAVCLGPAITLVHRSGKPVSYLTTGQRIPSDVEVATPRRLAELLVAGEAA
ncbi:MAG: 50S ribosome-binding GTPase [Chloroflexi bacterium]|nr:50S ribosome-binding GTPase [Chloroflexota bacterium]